MSGVTNTKFIAQPPTNPSSWMHSITQLDPPTLTDFDIFEPRQFSPSHSIGSINKELYEEEWDIWPEDANDHIVEFEESYLNWLKNYESF